MTTARRDLQASPRRAERATVSPGITVGPLAASLIVCLGGLLIGLVAGESGLVVIAALLAAIAALTIALRPDRATLVVVAILYSNAAAIAVQRYDVPFFAGAAFPLLLVIPLAYHVVLRRQAIVIASGLPYLIGYFVVVIMGTTFGMSADPGKALDMFVTFIIEGLLIYVATTNVVRSLGDLRLIVWVLLLVGGFLGALSVHQQATGAFDNEYGGFSQVSEASLDTDPLDGSGGQPRLSGPIGEKNRYAQIMVVLIPLGLFRIWDERRSALRLLAGACTVLIAFGAILTFSRGAALGLAVTIALMAILRYIKLGQLVAVLLAAAVLFAIQPTYAERLLTLEALSGATGTKGSSQVEDASIRKRANETIAALLVFADHPIIGVGRGLFPSYYGKYADEVGIASDTDSRQAHNLYAGILAETGLLGFICFMGIFIATLVDLERVRRRWRDLAPRYANMAIAFALAIVAYLTTGMFLHLAYERYLWILLALAGAAAHVGLQEARADRDRDDGAELAVAERDAGRHEAARGRAIAPAGTRA